MVCLLCGPSPSQSGAVPKNKAEAAGQVGVGRMAKGKGAMF